MKIMILFIKKYWNTYSKMLKTQQIYSVNKNNC